MAKKVERVEVDFQQLMQEIMVVDNKRQVLEDDTKPVQEREHALKDALTYAGFLARHTKKAYSLLSDVQDTPSSVSVTLPGATFTWHLG